MKSAVFYGLEDLRVEESPMPRLSEENNVLVRVMACGVCGTDVHIYEGDKGAAEVHPPVILGHEFSGVVEEVLPGVTRVKVGDRVCIDPNQLCGSCSYCLGGIGHFCRHMKGIGTTRDGGFAQFAAVPASQVHILPDSVTFEQGAMTEPVACCLHGIDLCGIRPGDAVCVIGGGMIGLIMVQLSRLSGASRVVLVEPVESKREMGKRLGADTVIDPFREDVKAAVAAAGIERLAVVIECAGLPGCIEQAIDIAGLYSTVMMFGLTKPDDTIALKPFTIFQKEITLKASFINPYTQDRALALIGSGRLDVSSMVAEVRPLEGLAEVLSSPALRAKGKYIIRAW